MKKWIKLTIVLFAVVLLAGAGLWIWNAENVKREANSFAWPVKISDNQKVKLNRDFGLNFNPIWEKVDNNTSLDIDAKTGDKVYASRDGVVDLSSWHGGYGICVRIDHGDGYKTLYGHLFSTLNTIKNGKSVKKGDVIGMVGSTGLAMDDQLSFSITKDEKYIDPKSLLPKVAGFEMVNLKPASNKTVKNLETGFICPFKKGMYKNVDLTPGFGNRINPVSNLTEFHTGIDVNLPVNAEIMAVGPGKVIKSEWFGGYGNFIEIDHGNGIKSRYGHLNELLVKKDETVEMGQIIGLCGSTGYSVEPHLHFEIMKGKEFLDPMEFVNLK
jgi:murein DD-endopeptidase MepM/ murein hydrolase activator NlpD